MEASLRSDDASIRSVELPRVVLPFFTAALPLVAGWLPFLHGALAGLLALAVPLAIDGICAASGEVGYRAESSRPKETRVYRVAFYMYSAAFLVSFSNFALTSHSLSSADVAGRMFSWVILSGVPTLVVGHALIHGTSKVGRLVGQSVFSVLNYPHFPMVHIEEHHRHVATGKDIHSAPLNRTFYAFFARSLVGELAAALGTKRRTRALVLAALQAAILIAVAGVGGARGLVIFLLTTFLARGVVALVNYIQHYGLCRLPGEKPGVDHSWDLPHKSASWLYFNAGFHADHHAKASLDPDALSLKSTSFVLPYNIPFILPMALVPPLFFRTMNPIVERALQRRA